MLFSKRSFWNGATIASRHSQLSPNDQKNNETMDKSIVYRQYQNVATYVQVGEIGLNSV